MNKQSIAETIKVRSEACKLYVMFTRLKDGRQRFQFADGSYIDFEKVK